MGKHRNGQGGNRSGYEVGYCKPPSSTRFRPGVSGNPKGRPPKRKSVSEHIEAILNEKIRVTVNGRQERKSRLEVGLTAIGNDLARGNLKAGMFLLSLRDRYRDCDATAIDAGDLSPADRALLMDYVRRSDRDEADDPAAEEEGKDDVERRRRSVGDKR